MKTYSKYIIGTAIIFFLFVFVAAALAQSPIDPKILAARDIEKQQKILSDLQPSVDRFHTATARLEKDIQCVKGGDCNFGSSIEKQAKDFQ